MTEDREAKVVISADTRQYTQGIKDATAQTSKLESSLNKLTAKMDGLLKRTGKKLIIFGSADLAVLSGAATVAATLEKQMSQIEATAAGFNKEMGNALDPTRMKENIRDLSREFPIARGEIVQLETAITKMGLTTTNQVNNMTRAFVNLGGATGESSIALAQGQIGLSRQMGTLGSATTMNKMNDSLTTLSTLGGVPAQDILGFSQQIAPVARAAGISQPNVMGISTAFNRAGVEGGYSANIFAGITNDLVRMKQTGSPEIRRYANALGVDTEKIKQMNPAEVFDLLAKKAGTDEGVRTLTTLGIDSVRGQKALQGIAAEGGIGKWMQTGTEGYGNDMTKTQADVAFSGFFDTLEELRNKFTDITQALGEPILKPLTLLAQGLNKFLGILQPIIDIGAKLASIGGGVGGVAAIGGGMLLRSWAGLSTPLLAKRAVSSSTRQAMQFGFSHGSIRGGGMEPAEDMGSWGMDPNNPNRWGRVNRGLYRGMGFLGGLFPSYMGDDNKAHRPINPFRVPMNMALMAGGATARWFENEGIDHQRKSSLASGTERIGYKGRGRGFFGGLVGGARHGFIHEMMGDSPSGAVKLDSSNIAEHKQKESFGDQLSRKFNEIVQKFRTAISEANKALILFAKSLRTAAGQKFDDITTGKGKGVDKFKSTLADGTKIFEQHNQALFNSIGVQTQSTKATLAEMRARAASTPVFKQLRMEGYSVVKAFGMLTMAAGRTARSMMGAGIGAGLRGAGQGLMGLMGLAGGHPVATAGLVAMGAGMQGWQATDAEAKSKNDFYATILDSSNNLRVYNDALGKATDSLLTFTGAVTTAMPATVNAALSDPGKLSAKGMGKDYTDTRWKDMSPDQAQAYLKSLGRMDPQTAEAVGVDVMKRFPGTQGEQLLRDLRQNQRNPKPNKEGYGAYFDTGTGISQQTRIGEVGWKEWIPAELGLPGLQNQYYAEAGKEGSPIRGAAEQAVGQYRGNVDYAARWQTTGSEETDKEMVATKQTLEGTKLLTDAAGKLANTALSKSTEANAMFEQTATALMKDMGVTEAEINERLESANIRDVDLASKSVNEREQWVWENFIKPNQQGQGYDELAQVETAWERFDVKLREYSAPTEQTMKDLAKVNVEGNDMLEKFGEDFAESNKIQKALNKPDDLVKQTKAIEELKDVALEDAKGNVGRQQALLLALGSRSDEAKPVVQQAIAEIQAKEQRSLAGANEMVQGRAKVQTLTGAIENYVEGDADSIAALKAAKGGAEDMVAALYVKTKEYHVAMEREQEDFDINRARANEDYNRQITYSDADFHRSQRFQKQDFYRSLRRQDEEYHIGLKRMVEDSAKTFFDPFKRVMAQGSRSGKSEIYNLERQNELMESQRKGLDKLKKMGLSQEAIDTLGLIEPGKTQQVDYWATGGITKKDIEKLNAQIGKRKGLTEDLTITEDNQGYRRGEEDRKRQIRHASEDFNRGIKRSMDEYLRQMKRADEEHKRSLNRQDQDRHRSLERAKDDLLGFAKDMKKSTKEQAEYAIGVLKDVNTEVARGLTHVIDKAIKKIEEADDLLDRGKRKRPKAPDGLPAASNPFAGKKAKGMSDFGRDFWGMVTSGWGTQPGVGGLAVGGIVTAPHQTWIGESGPEAVIPLNTTGMQWLETALTRAGVGKSQHVANKGMSFSEAKNAMTVYNNSTNFTGKITVVANDPNELATKLNHRARLQSLRGKPTKQI